MFHPSPCRFDRALQSRAVDPSSWTIREKYDLAGNAFSSVCSIAFLTAMMAAAPIEKAVAVKPLRGQGDPGEPEQDDSACGEEYGEEHSESETSVAPSDCTSADSLV